MLKTQNNEWYSFWIPIAVVRSDFPHRHKMRNIRFVLGAILLRSPSFCDRSVCAERMRTN